MDKKIESIVNEPSLYPEAKRKPIEERRRDLIIWYEKYDDINDAYNLHGMDLVDSAPCDEWLDAGIFRKQRYVVNSTFVPYDSDFKYSYAIISRDKVLTEMFAEFTLGRSLVVSSEAFLVDNTLKQRDENGIRDVADIRAFFEKYSDEKLVFKEYYGHSATQVSVVTVSEKGILVKGALMDFEEFINSLKNRGSIWLIQRFIKQHQDMARLNGSSVNTLRILSWNTGERVIVGDGIVRMGDEGSEVDNMDAGGYISGISNDGTLGRERYARIPVPVRKPNLHAGMKIPYFDDVKQLIVKMHSFLPEIYTLGWDIAITDKGPRLIEFNDGWNVKGIQTPPGNAQRKNWNDYLAEREKYYGIKYF